MSFFKTGRPAVWHAGNQSLVTVSGCLDARLPACLILASLPVAMLIRVMLKMTVILFFLVAPSYAFANQKFICSFYYMDKYHDEVNRLPAHRDKLKHCTLSCLVARKCLSFEVDMIGILKEIYDLIGPGNSELEDIEANRRGIRFAPAAQNERECMRFCAQVY